MINLHHLKVWHKIIFELIPLERLTYVLHKKTSQFYKVWTPYLDYMEPHYTTRNIVIVSFYISAVFFSSSPESVVYGVVLFYVKIWAVLIKKYIFIWVMSCYFCITAKIKSKIIIKKKKWLPLWLVLWSRVTYRFGMMTEVWFVRDTRLLWPYSVIGC